jgi:4-hydroxyphenylpyruvate dioxygenase-like putative hemolysin
MNDIHFFYLETGELIGLNKSNEKQAMIKQSYVWENGKAKRHIDILSIPDHAVLNNEITNLNSAKKFVRNLISF